jgi:hypothetical protein
MRELNKTSTVFLILGVVFLILGLTSDGAERAMWIGVAVAFGVVALTTGKQCD